MLSALPRTRVPRSRGNALANTREKYTLHARSCLSKKHSYYGRSGQCRSAERPGSARFRFFQDSSGTRAQPVCMEPSPATHHATPATAGFDLSEVYVHLGLGARAKTLPDFAWSEESLARYEADHQADGDEGRLVMIGPAEATWTSWERHPAGDEVVVVLSGRQVLIQEIGAQHHRIELHAGQAAINPRGVWHTADVSEPGSVLFITPGRGTEHRPRL